MSIFRYRIDKFWVVTIFLAVMVCNPIRAQDPGNDSYDSRSVTVNVGKHVVHIDGRQITITSQTGQLESISNCSMSYGDIVAFYTKIRQQVLTEDRVGLASLVHYPLRVNGGKIEKITNSDDFLEHFDEIFTTKVREQIKAAQPGLVFCRNGSPMLGSGILWSDVFEKEIKVYVVNQ